MLAVIFEFEPVTGRRQDYLDIAARLKPELEKKDGFISIEQTFGVFRCAEDHAHFREERRHKRKPGHPAVHHVSHQAGWGGLEQECRGDHRCIDGELTPMIGYENQRSLRQRRKPHGLTSKVKPIQHSGDNRCISKGHRIHAEGISELAVHSR